MTTMNQPARTLAKEINREHAAFTKTAVAALELARRCGELLIEAKALCGHGNWLPWLEAHCSVSPRQSQRYMKVAKNWEAIQSTSDAASFLTIDAAIGSVAIEGSAPADQAFEKSDVAVAKALHSEAVKDGTANPCGSDNLRRQPMRRSTDQPTVASDDIGELIELFRGFLHELRGYPYDDEQRDLFLQGMMRAVFDAFAEKRPALLTAIAAQLRQDEVQTLDAARLGRRRGKQDQTL